MENEKHKQFITTVFDRVAAGYDNEAMRYFPFSADHLVDLLRLQKGQKVLDIATGTGVAAMSAAQVVGAQGRVIGIDLSDAMLGQAQGRCKELGLDNVDWHIMDAEALEFRKEYFDAAMCSFGLFFMTDMDRALRHWQQFIKPGASFGFTSFGAQAFQPYLDEFRALCDSYGIAPENKQPSPTDRLKQPEDCREILRQTAYVDITVHAKQLGYYLPTALDWWTVVWNSGLRAMLLQLPEDDLARFQQEHLATVEKHMVGDGLRLDVEVLFACGRSESTADRA